MRQKSVRDRIEGADWTLTSREGFRKKVSFQGSLKCKRRSLLILSRSAETGIDFQTVGA